MIAQTIAAWGTWKVSCTASHCRIGVARSTGALPPVYITTMPWTTAFIPRVKTMEGMRRNATPSPFANPMTLPLAIATSGPSQANCSPHQPAVAVAVMPPIVTTQGIDRSICPSRITTIRPLATMPRNEATWSCWSR